MDEFLYFLFSLPIGEKWKSEKEAKKLLMGCFPFLQLLDGCFSFKGKDRERESRVFGYLQTL